MTTTKVPGNGDINATCNLGQQGSNSIVGSWISTIQYTRQQIINAINSGKVVKWSFDGTRGQARAGCCVVSTGTAITFVGLAENYSGTTPDFVVRGNAGLGLLGGTYSGSKATVTLPGSNSSAFSKNFVGYDADDYALLQFIASGDLG